MSTSALIRRPLLTVAAVLAAGVALMVALAVIPAVSAGEVPNITSDRAVPAFWASVELHALAIMVLLLVALRSKPGGTGVTVTLVVTAIGLLLLGLVLGDAAKTPLEVQSSPPAASALLFGCVLADLVAAALVIVAILRGKRAGGTAGA